MFNFALKIKGGGREVLRPCHPPKIWNVHLNYVIRGVILSYSWGGGGENQRSLSIFLAKFGMCISLCMNLKFQSQK